MVFTSKFNLIKVSLLLLVLFLKLPCYSSNVEEVVIKSSGFSYPVKVTVISPTSPELESGMVVPTVYLLNGYDGDHQSWLKSVPHLALLADRYGLRIICPDGLNSWYWDSPKEKEMAYASFFVKDLMLQLRLIYNLPDKRELTAITGFSMGGHGAFWLAVHYPNLFGAVGSISGGLDLRGFKTNWNLREHLGPYNENEKLWSNYTVTSHYSELQKHKFAIIFDCGVDDFFYSANMQFHNLLLEHKIPHDFISRPGAHTHSYSANSIEYQLLFFHKFFHK